MLAFGTYVLPNQFIFGATVALHVIVERILGPHAGRLFGALAATSLAVVATPFLAAIQARLYVELRMRKEAIDIEWALAPPSAPVAG
ncbi:MAG: hypothetical protein JF589_13995 [Gemmatimonadetes bacterium]|nr:hypothetical protein [Gemmatimonadota bacterium]